MNNRVRTVFNRRKQASDTTCAAVEIVVCLGRERFYFSIGIFRLSGNFWLVSFKISYLCLPLFYETRTTPSCHPSGCAYRQL